MRRTITGLLAVAAVACQDGVTEPQPVLGRAPADVEAAPATATVAGQSLAIEALLWRDFQRPAPQDGKPLIAAVRVRAAGGVPLLANVQADSVWVIAGGQAWIATAVQEQPRDPTADYLEVVARNGPKWVPGTRADVAIRVRVGSGRVVYLRVASQPITRTD